MPLLPLAFGSVLVSLVMPLALADPTIQVPTTAHSDTVHEEVMGTVTSLVLTSDVGDVTLRTVADGEPATIDQSRHWNVDEPQLTWSLSDGVLQVDVVCPATPGNGCYDDVTIGVPALASVSVRVDTGDVSSRGFRAPQDLRTGVGSLTVVRLRTTQLFVASDVDDVRVASSVVDRVAAGTGTGDVSVSLTRRPEEVQAVSEEGDVRVVVPSGRYAVLAKADLGDVRVKGIRRDSAASSVLRVSSDVGDVLVRGS